MCKFANLAGDRYGKLTVIEEITPRLPKVKWKCLCDCGTTTVVSASNLKSGHTKSCGCYVKEVVTFHGHSRRTGASRLYNIWSCMIQRGTNKTAPSSKNYVNRGIGVCDEWLKFDQFKEWALASGYAQNLSIERRNNNLGYSPENCAWETTTIQCRNRRSVKGSSSQYVGVALNKQTGKWIATIQVDKKAIKIGTYSTEIEAALARDNYVHEHKLPGFALSSGELNPYRSMKETK